MKDKHKPRRLTRSRRTLIHQTADSAAAPENPRAPLWRGAQLFAENGFGGKHRRGHHHVADVGKARLFHISQPKDHILLAFGEMQLASSRRC